MNEQMNTLGTITSDKGFSESVTFGKQLSRLLLRTVPVSIHAHTTPSKSSMSEPPKSVRHYGHQKHEGTLPKEGPTKAI